MITSTFVTWPCQPVYCLTTLLVALACVPRDSEHESNQVDENLTADSQSLPRWRPRSRLPPRQTTTGTDAPIAPNDSPRALAPPLTTVFKEDFERAQLGPDWTKTTDRWSLREGRLCVSRARNHPLWLNRRLPTNARIEFTAESFSADGDIKVEAWGNGRAFAHGTTYDDATSYLFIFGGWKNSLHVLARLNEHGGDRLELGLFDGDDRLKHSRVATAKRYHFSIERTDLHTVRWSVDGETLFSFDDTEPLRGQGHEYFAFNGWDAEVCFDDLRITPLDE